MLQEWHLPVPALPAAAMEVNQGVTSEHRLYTATIRKGWSLQRPDEVFFQVAVLVVRAFSLEPHAVACSLLENFDFSSFHSLFPVVEADAF